MMGLLVFWSFITIKSCGMARPLEFIIFFFVIEILSQLIKFYNSLFFFICTSSLYSHECRFLIEIFGEFLFVSLFNGKFLSIFISRFLFLFFSVFHYDMLLASEEQKRWSFWTNILCIAYVQCHVLFSPQILTFYFLLLFHSFHS